MSYVRRGFFILGTGIVLGFMLSGILICQVFKHEVYPYYQGQIDALNGKIFYYKATNENNEIVWKHK
jgi:hypothetical protein